MMFYYKPSTKWAFALALVSASCKSDPQIRPEGPGTPPAQQSGDASFADSELLDRDGSVTDTSVLPSRCPSNLPGAPMVEVPTANGTTYCIDSREVSQGEYFEFLKAFLVDPTGPAYSEKRPDVGPWPTTTGCEGNGSLMPNFGASETTCETTPTSFSRTNQYPNMPVACVDWCDAYAYCAWAKKRLCGRIGGGTIVAAEENDPARGEWLNACSQGGKTKYSYGNGYNPDYPTYAGGGADAASAGFCEATQETGCRGTLPPFNQLINLGCNVVEWEASYDVVELSVIVHGMGSGTQSPELGSRCDSSLHISPLRQPNVGFRCCHD